MKKTSKLGRKALPQSEKLINAVYRLHPKQKAHIEAKGGAKYIRALIEADMNKAEA